MRARARGALERAEPSARVSRAARRRFPRPRAPSRATSRANDRFRDARDDDDDDDDDARARQFLRLARDARDGSWALQSATVTLRPRDASARATRTLRVCALVHYGEARYYRGVAKDFETRENDATLVELITSRKHLEASDARGLKLWRLSEALAPTAVSARARRSSATRGRLGRR